MSTALEAVDAAIQEVTKARTFVSKIRASQVKGADELAALGSLAYAWFNTHRPVIEKQLLIDSSLVDDAYQTVLNSTARSAAKSTYLGALTRAKGGLLELRSGLLKPVSRAASLQTDDIAPNFSPLVGSVEMRDVLARRWDECQKCVGAKAHLAAIVMMGGLLEALFMARANLLPDKSSLVKAAAAPKNKEGKTLDYRDWMLDSYIKVGHELNWITGSAKQVADVLKEFRNYVHPAKELRHGISLAANDSLMFWSVTKALVRQLLESASKP